MPPQPVVEIAQRLVAAGFETWCVGGAVRDALLGHEHLDWDLATAAKPGEVRRLFRRTVPVGIEFGTVGVFDSVGRMHEVTTFRRDVQTDGRHAVVEFGASLDEDLARRDFTINAIAFDPLSGRLHDPFMGQQDLQARLVRAVGVAEERMREDRLRALRAIRFAARFGFEFDPATWKAIVGSAPYLSRLSAERVKQEIEKTMEQVRFPSKAFRWWRESGAFGALVPALHQVSDVTLGSIDCLSPPTLAARPARRLLRIAALFAELDRTDAERSLKALRFSNADTSAIGSICGAIHHLGDEMRSAVGAGSVSDRQLRMWVAPMGRTRVSGVLRVMLARWSAMRNAGIDAPHDATARMLFRRMVRVAFNDPVETGDLAADGDDLRSAGIPPGPHLGRILATLLLEVLDDPERNNRDYLVKRATELYSNSPTQ